MENPTDKDRLLLKHQWLDHRFQYEDNNVAFTNVQPQYYRVRQVEPCHYLGWSSQALILSILALGAMPKQQQQQPKNSSINLRILNIIKDIKSLKSWPIAQDRESHTRYGHNICTVKVVANPIYVKTILIHVRRSTNGKTQHNYQVNLVRW